MLATLLSQAEDHLHTLVCACLGQRNSYMMRPTPGSLRPDQPPDMAAGKSDGSVDARGSATADDEISTTGKQAQQATSPAAASPVQVLYVSADVAEQTAMQLTVLSLIRSS